MSTTGTVGCGVVGVVVSFLFDFCSTPGDSTTTNSEKESSLDVWADESTATGGFDFCCCFGCCCSSSVSMSEEMDSMQSMMAAADSVCSIANNELY